MIPPLSSTLEELLRDAPSNWGRWGKDDEVGALNFLDEEQLRRGLMAARQARSFTLGAPVATDGGDPVFPGRWPARHFMVADRAGFENGHWQAMPGGLEFADDYLVGFAQSGTHCDGLGHMWFGGQIWNGFPASSTNGGMTRAGIAPIARRGIVGHGILLDMARHRGKPVLDRAEAFSHRDLLDCAQAQGVAIAPRSILMIRTGWLGALLDGRQSIGAGYWEPGLTYSLELARWFEGMEIPCLVTDTLANETTYHARTGAQLVLHAALMRNLGIVFTEMAVLDGLAEDCAADRRYEGLFCAAPVAVSKGTGGAANPVFVK
jgi:kynurenine formamidase